MRKILFILFVIVIVACKSKNEEIKENLYFTSSLEDAIYLAKSLIKNMN